MEKNFEKIGIIFNPEFNDSKTLAKKISQKIKNANIFSIDNLKNNIDLAIVIGGDGTFLKASRFYSKKDIPIIGFNVGRLGYLALMWKMAKRRDASCSASCAARTI